MRRSHWKMPVFFGAFFALMLSLAPAQGAFIATETTTVTQLSNASFLYSYTVNVATSSTISASEFDLSLVGAINPNSIINPSNFFNFYNVGDPFIQFIATGDDPTQFNGISPGSSGTFSFTSLFAPVTGSYQIQGLDSNAGVVDITGSTLVPGVPEPSSLLMSGLGLCGALGWIARSRRSAV